MFACPIVSYASWCLGFQCVLVFNGFMVLAFPVFIDFLCYLFIVFAFPVLLDCNVQTPCTFVMLRVLELPCPARLLQQCKLIVFIMASTSHVVFASYNGRCIPCTGRKLAWFSGAITKPN